MGISKKVSGCGALYKKFQRIQYAAIPKPPLSQDSRLIGILEDLFEQRQKVASIMVRSNIEDEKELMEDMFEDINNRIKQVLGL